MTAQEIRSTVDEMVVAALELVNDFDQTDEAAIDDVTASRPELRSLVALCFDRQEGSECLSDAEIAAAMVDAKPELITPKDYTYRTDGEMGTIEAVDFADACAQLDALVPQVAIEDGGWGWVDDCDGERPRYEIGSWR